MSEDFDAARAARMYPNTPQDAPAPAVDLAAEPATGGQTVVHEPGADVPQHIAELRQADQARRLYSVQSLYSIPDGALGSDIDHKEACEVAADLGAEDADLQALAGLAREAPTEEQVQTWRADTQAFLQRMQVPARDIELARKLVARDPRLATYLDATGLGDHPKVVERMIALAKTQAGLRRLR